MFFRYYTKNIGQIHLYTITNNDQRKEVNVNPNPADGYGLPTIASLNLDKDAYLKKIEIQFEVKEKELPYELVFSSLDLVNYKIKDEISPSSVFQKKPFDNSQYSSQQKSNPFQSHGELASFPENITNENFKGRIDVDNVGKIDNKELLAETILLLLEDYPFYKEKEIDKNSFLKSSKQFLDRNIYLSKCEFVDSINSYLNRTISDPHFKIRSACEKPKRTTPVYTYRIGDKYVVSAIFDEELQKKIPVGSALLKINGRALTKNMDYKEINDELLKQPVKSYMSLDFIRPSGESDNVTYFIKDKYEIPENFKPRNLYLKKINDSLVYFKINKITYELNTAYLNNLDLINSSKGLVLDLRGCTGGDFLAASQFLSYFIGNEFVFFNYGYDKSGKKESVIVNESKNRSYNYHKKGKIVVLVDADTACVAEMIVHALVKYRKDNTHIVSKDKHTAGALSFAYEIYLPEGVTVVTNALGDKRKIFLDEKIIEDKGIKPDLFIEIQSVEDLQPYKDKVLEKAISNFLL
ncbi:S41 family peptidase [Chryseobacterium indologenes]|uniref:S41 family peptidase n=1 Tax=Chryseobacterium indologenes TaxID=253 RepID=UPI004057F729